MRRRVHTIGIPSLLLRDTTRVLAVGDPEFLRLAAAGVDTGG